MTTYLRYYPVRVGRCIGDYTNRFLCWSIADHEHANRTNGEKFDTLEQAQLHANVLNTAHFDVGSDIPGGGAA